MERSLEDLVWERANGCCEYCRMPRRYDRTPFEIDHIVARVHGGPTLGGNLALGYFLNNSYKGTNLSGIDPKTRRGVRLFHPRPHWWYKHFRRAGAVLTSPHRNTSLEV